MATASSMLSLVAVLIFSNLFCLCSAAPAPSESWSTKSYFPVVDQWLKNNRPGKYHEPCTENNIKIRKDFAWMEPWERKAYTDAIKCLMTKPSQLNQELYPAATSRYMDYAVIHVNRTRLVHISGFFLTWHRYYLWLFESDLADECGYDGNFPYWNWPATADNLHGSAIFDGSEYSMSGDGQWVDTGDLILSPTLSLPQGSGGGCVNNGPFAWMQTTMQSIPTTYIIQGLPLPEWAFQLNESCLTRDLNTYASQTYTTWNLLYKALNAPNASDFHDQINGVIGGGSLGLHSGAHFVVGAPASSIYVSPQDPVWYPMHTMLDHLYTSWQMRHPEIAIEPFGTQTALNTPPSKDVTLQTIEPDWGYLEDRPLAIGELVSTTSGPFCYRYDSAL